MAFNLLLHSVPRLIAFIFIWSTRTLFFYPENNYTNCHFLQNYIIQNIINMHILFCTIIPFYFIVYDSYWCWTSFWGERGINGRFFFLSFSFLSFLSLSKILSKVMELLFNYVDIKSKYHLFTGWLFQSISMCHYLVNLAQFSISFKNTVLAFLKWKPKILEFTIKKKSKKKIRVNIDKTNF